MAPIDHVGRRRVIAGGILSLASVLAVMSPGAALALDEVPYGVAKEPWTEGLGNHRAIVRVEHKADAVLVRIPWRRRDRDPEHKQILVMDAASGQRVTNIARLHLDRFEGVLVFQPQTAPGDYFVYYLPFLPEPGWGNFSHDYLPPQETAAADWKARLPAGTQGLPRAAVVRLEAQTEFDSFFPMEVVATPEETQAMLARSAESKYVLFPEDRRFPIRMTDELPLRWVKSGPAKEFHGEARRNEFYVFQIGVWAARTNLAGLDVEFKGEIARWLNCFNTGGTNWDGKPFHKSINVAQGKVQALWIGVNVPRDAKPGEHHATVKVIPKNAAPSKVELTVKVLPSELADRGDSEPWRLGRLRWLDSTLGADSDPTSPYPPLTLSSRSVTGGGFRVKFRASQVCDLPSQLDSGVVELLHGPLGLFVDGTSPSFKRLRRDSLPELASDGAGRAKLVSERTAPNLNVRNRAMVEFDGTLSFKTQFRCLGDFKADNLRLEIPLRPEVATYFMGIGLTACKTPTNYTWRWEGPYNSFWIGNAHAGLHVKLLGSSYEGPMQNLYRPKPPPSWFNDGKGGVTITNGPNGEVLVQVFTGPFDLKAGEERTFDFSLLVTPVKPLDTATHFRERYWHSTHDIPGDVNVINVHHATTPNPFINYPFLAVDKLREFCHTQQAQGRKVKIYYTVRELTTHLPELWALRSLGDEVLAGGPGGGFPWLREHLVGNYTTAWYTMVEGGFPDAAILTSGASRWYNFYVEGINWLARNVPIDGLYLDDVAYDRTILKRVRKVLDRARPGCLIDLHSNTLFSKGPANQYTEFFPYVNRLWFGEGFDYDAMSPGQWLVECSGIPFGLMGDMLQDGGNRWRGMLFGMTARMPWSNTGARPVWKLWDEFGIGEARMIGWWEPTCPVRTDRPDVLATAYVKPGKTLVALASWAPEKTEVRLNFLWNALGLDGSKARLVAPEVKDFQPAKTWRPDEPITVEPKCGWLIYVAE
ncbi:MAG: glycoside hydrolase domain-containing protein [Limisphaerales bacterium]